MLLIPDKHFHSVLSRETFDHIVAVHPDSLDQVISHADIERSVFAAGQNVDVESYVRI
jgi:hypothetical protein